MTLTAQSFSIMYMGARIEWLEYRNKDGQLVDRRVTRLGSATVNDRHEGEINYYRRQTRSERNPRFINHRYKKEAV